jgi:hypothetical protein
MISLQAGFATLHIEDLLQLAMLRNYLRLLLSCTALTLLVGCGGDGTAAVSGQLNYKGKPVPNADVTFTPEAKDGKPANGRTDASGRFSLRTATKGEGASPGNYRVHIIARGPDRPPRPGEASTGMPGEMMPGEPLIPQKYFSPDSSGLTFEVKRGGNTANFELKD